MTGSGKFGGNGAQIKKLMKIQYLLNGCSYDVGWPLNWTGKVTLDRKWLFLAKIPKKRPSLPSYLFFLQMLKNNFITLRIIRNWLEYYYLVNRKSKFWRKWWDFPYLLNFDIFGTVGPMKMIDPSFESKKSYFYLHFIHYLPLDRPEVPLFGRITSKRTQSLYVQYTVWLQI